MFGVEAPTPGTGKTALVQAALIPALGTVPLTSEPHGNEEMEKRITSLMLKASPAVVFDNVDRLVNYPALANALTSPTWQGRELGVSRMTESPISCTWAMTANNPQYSSDIARRVVRIQLDAGVPNPEKRGFRNKRFLESTLAKRGELIWAALILIKTWVARERPEPAATTPTLAGYGPWRRVLGGVLTLHGWPGLLGNLPKEEEAATSPDQELFGFLAQVATEELGGRPFGSSDLLPALTAEEDMAALLGEGRGTMGVRLGLFLRDKRSNVVMVDDVPWRLVRLSGRRRGGYRWQFLPEVDRG